MVLFQSGYCDVTLPSQALDLICQSVLLSCLPYRLCSGRTQASKSVTGNGWLMYSSAMTKCFARAVSQLHHIGFSQSLRTQVRQHAPEDRKGSRRLLVETMPCCARKSFKIFECPQKGRHLDRQMPSYVANFIYRSWWDDRIHIGIPRHMSIAVITVWVIRRLAAERAVFEQRQNTCRQLQCRFVQYDTITIAPPKTAIDC